jgi:hypothetical protein
VLEERLEYALFDWVGNSKTMDSLAVEYRVETLLTAPYWAKDLKNSYLDR